MTPHQPSLAALRKLGYTSMITPWHRLTCADCGGEFDELFSNGKCRRWCCRNCFVKANGVKL